MIRLATFLKRTDFEKTTPKITGQLKMPQGQNIKMAETEAQADQYGLVNNAVSGNTFETTVDFFQLHFTSTLAVVGLGAAIVLMCCCWRMLKAKNLAKIARFICIRRCRVTEDMLSTETPAAAPRMTTSHGDLMEMDAMVNLANKTMLENAYLRNSGATPMREGSSLSAC